MMTENEINPLIIKVSQAIKSAMEEAHDYVPAEQPPANPNRLIKDNTVLCLEFGKHCKTYATILFG